MKHLAIIVFLFAAHPAWADGEPPPLLLAGKFGDLCSMCAATIRCTPAAEGGVVTTYTFHQLSFAGQMRTVFDYVPGMKPATQSRPITIQADGAAPQEDSASFDRKAARIDLLRAGGQPTHIDRRSGDWSQGDVTLGHCALVPRVRKTMSAP